MSTESLTNRTLKIYIWAQFMCVELTPDTEIVSNRDVYDNYYIPKLQKQKKKRIFIKETKRPMQSTETYRRAKDREHED